MADSLVVEVPSSDYESRPYDFQDKETGERVQGVNAQQLAYLHMGALYPMPFKIKLDGKNPRPFAKGRYAIDGSSFKTNAYGQLELSRELHLTPLSGK